MGLFGDMLKPGDAARIALRKELEVRKANWRFHTVYKGQGDLLLRHGTFFGGRELPDYWEHLRGERNKCHMNALAAVQQDSSLRYFTGLYQVGRVATDHSWAVDENGEVVEVTFPDREDPAGTMLLDGHAIPWLPPAHWAYVGVELCREMVEWLVDYQGLPVWEPTPWPDDEIPPIYKREFDPNRTSLW